MMSSGKDNDNEATVYIYRSFDRNRDSRVQRNASLFPHKSVKIIDNPPSKKVRSIQFEYIGKLLKICRYLIFICIIIPKSVISSKSHTVHLFMDLECAILGVLAARITGRYAIFDIVDPFGYTKIRQFSAVQHMFILLENLVATMSNLTLAPHQRRLDIYPISFNSVIVENVPRFSKLSKTNISVESGMQKKIAQLQDLGGFDLKIGYFGSLDIKTRGLELLIEVARMYPNVAIIIAGKGRLSDDLLKIDQSNLFFLGEFKSDDLSELYKAVDFTWMYYSFEDKLHSLACPNKYYEHLYFSTPCIASSNIPNAIDIREFNTGVVLNKDMSSREIFGIMLNYNCADANFSANLKLPEEYYRAVSSEIHDLMPQVSRC